MSSTIQCATILISNFRNLQLELNTPGTPTEPKDLNAGLVSLFYWPFRCKSLRCIGSRYNKSVGEACKARALTSYLDLTCSTDDQAAVMAMTMYR